MQLFGEILNGMKLKMTNYNSDEKTLIRKIINEHEQALKYGNFGKAKVLRNKLEALGINADFESNFEPQK